MIKKFLHRTYELNTSRGNLFVRNIVSNVAVKPIQYFISLGSFAKNKNGVLAVMFALAAIPIILSIGAAIDFARVYVAKAQLGEALDKAALAVAVSRNASDAQIEAIFQ
ncbi:MAG TPA: pilus assembly protein, partial [Alphaproteobacteria bacterium]|nr:pilus assembly protein [Alphaproteobacteria bacterium]